MLTTLYFCTRITPNGEHYLYLKRRGLFGNIEKHVWTQWDSCTTLLERMYYILIMLHTKQNTTLQIPYSVASPLQFYSVQRRYSQCCSTVVCNNYV